MLQGEPTRRKLTPQEVYLHAHSSCPALFLARPHSLFSLEKSWVYHLGLKQQAGSTLRAGVGLSILFPAPSMGPQRC